MKVCICDDSKEELYRYEKKIKKLSEKHGIQLELVLYESGTKLLFDMEETTGKPDVIYLDVHMPGESGVEVAETLREQKFENEIIFLTVSEDFMLNGFDVEALHYVVKNKTSMEKFEQIFLKAFDRISTREREVVSFSCAGDTCTVPVDEIKFFEVRHRVITVHYREELFEFYSPLEKVENMLCANGFIRTHRSYLVSLKYVASRSYEELVLIDGTRIPIGRIYTKQVREIWEEYRAQKSA